MLAKIYAPIEQENGTVGILLAVNRQNNFYGYCDK